MIVTRNILQNWIAPNSLVGSCLYGWSRFDSDLFDVKKINNALINFIEFQFRNGTECKPSLRIESEKYNQEVELVNYQDSFYRLDFDEYFKEFKAFILFVPSSPGEAQEYATAFNVKINYSIDIDDVNKSLKIPNNINKLKIK